MLNQERDNLNMVQSPGGSDGKESACNAGVPGSIPGSRRSSGEENGCLPTPVLLPGEFHGQRYSPWGHKETQLSN